MIKMGDVCLNILYQNSKNNLEKKEEFSHLSEVLFLLSEDKIEENESDKGLNVSNEIKASETTINNENYNVSVFNSGLEASLKSEKYLLGIKLPNKHHFSKNITEKSDKVFNRLDMIKDKNDWHDDVKFVLVDFDGTLVNSKNIWIKAYRLYCKKNQIPFNKQATIIFKEKTFDEWLQILNCDYDELLSIAIKLFEKLVPKDIVIEILDNLKDDCKITIISREPIEIIENWVKSWGLYNITNIIIEGDARKSSSYYDVKNLMLIDDNYNNCKAAKLSGAKVIGINDYHSLKNQTKMLKICDKYFQ